MLTTKEEYPLLHQSHHSEYPGRNQQFDQILSQQSHTQSEAMKKEIINIQIVIPKLTKANPLFQRFFARNNTELKSKQLSIVNSSTKLANDELFLRKDHKFRVFLSTGFHQFLDIGIKNYYHVNQKEESKLNHNDDRNHQLLSIILIEKLSIFLRSNSDRFKLNQFYENLFEIKKY
jgi:hypothetical protein